jgi:tetratricopeptide (TPR) repeat protein
LAVSVLLLAACFFTAYRPVLAAHRHIANAMQSSDWQAAERECRAATEADPWWSEPWELLADLAYQRWQAAPSRGNLQEFELFATKASDADPHSSRLHRRCGDWWLQMFRRSGAAELGQRAVAAYRRAAELYPNSGILHAQLAWALHSTGQAEEAAAQAEQALALDQLTPHEEYWLRNQQLVGAPPTLAGSEAPANAEQMMLKLRNSDKED